MQKKLLIENSFVKRIKLIKLNIIKWGGVC